MSVSNFFRGWWGSAEGDPSPPELEDEGPPFPPPIPPISRSNKGGEESENLNLEQLLKQLKIEAEKPLAEEDVSKLSDLVEEVERQTDRIISSVDRIRENSDIFSIHIRNNYDVEKLNKFQNVLDGKYHLMMSGGDDFGQELFRADGKWIYGSEKMGSGVCYSYIEDKERANQMILTMFFDPRTDLQPFDWEVTLAEMIKYNGKKFDLEYMDEDDETTVYFIGEDNEVYMKSGEVYKVYKVSGNADRLGRFVLDQVLFLDNWSWIPQKDFYLSTSDQEETEN